jgi:hypothetical protein
MAEQEETKGRGFTIIDRRGQGEAEGEAEPASDAAETGPPEHPGPDVGQLPGIDFSTFVLSLGTSALYHMGLAPDPASGERAETNLPLARQTIDTLEMLEEKTRGNLEEDEMHLLESLLYELRMRFVEVSK